MEDLERINQVEKVLVDSLSICNLLDEMYYKNKIDNDVMLTFEEADKKFRECRKLLIKNLANLKESLQLNFNLFLALQLHLTIITNEMEKIQNIENIDVPLTIKKEDIESNSSSSTDTDSSTDIEDIKEKMNNGVKINIDSSSDDDLYLYCKKCSKESETFCLNGYCKECRNEENKSIE
jgi:hypothetical protein